MTAAVRLFCCEGLIAANVVGGTRLSYDSVQHLKFPPLGRDLLSCTTVDTDISDAAQAGNATTVAYIQVQQGKTIHYEVIPSGFDVRAADTTSPTLSGSTTINFGPGWRISVLEAS